MARANAFTQYMVELINRLRLDPGGEFARIVADQRTSLAHDEDVTAALRYFGVSMSSLKQELAALSPAQPLAWNGRLADAALAHTVLLQETDSQSHQVTSRGEPVLGDRLLEAGYQRSAAGENVYSYAESARHAHDAFVVDWGYGPGGMQTDRGHRLNLLHPSFEEIGIGMIRDQDAATQVGPHLVTQNFGARSGAGPFLTGVAYRDKDGDGMYSMGEGARGMKVALSGRGADKSEAAGGYGLEPGEGIYDLTLSGKPVKGRIKAEIFVTQQNAKLDLVDGRHLQTSADLDLKKGAASVTVLGAGDVDLWGKSGRDKLVGGAGANRLEGEGGRDKLIGGGGRDKLIGGNGDDQLKGGPGRDVFQFDAKDGDDRILDWNEGDRLALSGKLTFADVEIARHRGDALLSFGDTTVTIEDQAGEIHRDDFIFV